MIQSNPAYRVWWQLRGKEENEICEECDEAMINCVCEDGDE